MENLAVESLTFTYPGQMRPALRGVTLCVKRGEFVVLCGPSGSGKTTLLRQLRSVLAPYGDVSGRVLLDGRPIGDRSLAEQSAAIGFVQQSPENQIVTDKVWHELAFGLESLGVPSPEIRRRVAEMAAFFGIEDWFYKSTGELSGGQKQLLNLASVMVMRPEVLVLDEPVSRLDPVATSDFLTAVGRINRELGVTVLMTAHNLDDALAYASRVVVMDRGKVVCDGTPAEAGEALLGERPDLFAAMPVPMRVWASVRDGGRCPATIPEGRSWLSEYAAVHELLPVPERERPTFPGEPRVLLRNVWFRYDKESPDVLRGLSLAAYPGEILALVGGNGAGKTTALTVAAGLRKPYRGKTILRGRAAVLPQDVQTLFLKDTVHGELEEVLQNVRITDREAQSQIRAVASLCALGELLDRHPYDLSGGEQQRAALAKVLLTRPDILLLDEPTRGMDAASKRGLAEILRSLAVNGASIVIVSHDVEFCAETAHRCAMLFDGSLTCESVPGEFFVENFFYTTAAARMSREIVPGAVMAADLIAACGGAEPPSGGDSPWPDDFYRGLPPSAAEPPARKHERTLRSRLIVAAALVLMPCTIYVGAAHFGDRKYYFISLLVLLEALTAFAAAFEGRKPQAREIIVVAVLCALAVAGRAAFFMLPSFKPVLAIVILSGAAFGGETGFLVGSVAMLASNLLFGQGPWTPWQMFAMGVGGFLAGILFAGDAPKNRWVLCAYGVIAALLLYGPIMNLASVVMWQKNINCAIILAAMGMGLPFDLIHAAATAAFLLLGADPLLRKLDRVKIKYGIILRR